MNAVKCSKKWILPGITVLLVLFTLGHAYGHRPRPVILETLPLATAAPGTGPVDLNTADEALLDALPGIGPALAGNILAWREENGPFTGPEDLMAVPGIGPATYEKICHFISFRQQETAYENSGR